MSAEELRPLLAKERFFDGLADTFIDKLADCASDVRFAAGDMLFREGDLADWLYVVRQGRVVLELSIPGREPVMIQTCGEGDVIGLSWMAAPHRWRYSGRAMQATRAIALNGGILRDKCREDHDLGYEVFRRVADVLAHRLEATRLQLLDLYSDRT